MDILKINMLFYYALSKSEFVIDSSSPTIFRDINNFLIPPFFRFRYKNVDKSDLIYHKIAFAIDAFEGHLDWCLSSNEESSNYLIIPEVFKDYLDIPKAFYSDYIINNIGSELYNDYINKSIEDIPKLAKVLENCVSAHST